MSLYKIQIIQTHFYFDRAAQQMARCLGYKKAKKFDYIPKITPKKFEKNIIEKDKIELEISKLKEDIVNTTVKLSEALSDEVFQLQSQKKAFLKERDYYKSRLERINRSIKNKVNSSNFELLLAYFPNVNIERLENIDSFHNGITKILSQELLQARKDASKNLEAFNNELNIIDIKIDDLVENSRHNNYLFEKLFELSGKVSNIELENKFFVESNRLQKEIISTETVLSESKQQSLSTVMDRINKKIISINEKIHTEKRRAPELTLFEKDYEYKVFDNTGTGKAYTNLFILDICIFDLTPLPILIHDSVLFKNVENSVVDNIIELYDEQRKQTFISIDELNKYSSTTQEILITHSVIQLSKDKLLFDKDWRA
ncbi:DUF2326 domain-containing protein [Paenibacillus polymyxa]|uniref:DUF2326 domain-containing protein n=1 Tax=Paenibacillus polymyxa TaxID=1406 RepID=UPI0032AEE00F